MNSCLVCGKKRFINNERLWNTVYTMAYNDKIAFFSVCDEHKKIALGEVLPLIMTHNRRVLIKFR